MLTIVSLLSGKVVVERETGRSRGFGFVSYAEGSSVDECIAALDGKVGQSWDILGLYFELV